MGNVVENITYYAETFFDRLGKLIGKWRYLPWETKVKVKGVLSALALYLAYSFYSKSWNSFSEIERGGLVLFVIAVLGMFTSTLIEVLGPNRFK